MRPMSSFCCGCPLGFGVCIVIFLNLVQNLFYITVATMNIILRVPTVGAGSGLISQTANAAWCLLGMPFIFAAIWGVVYRQEANVRLYLYYMCVSFGLDIFYIIAFFVTTDMCVHVPSALNKHGTAFACGFMRLLGLTFILMMLIIVTYCIFTVWSYCEDLKAGGGGAGFPALLAGAGELRIKRRQAQYGGVPAFGETFSGYGNAEFMNFNSYSAPGLGASRLEFDGNWGQGGYHEISYPPPKAF